MRVNCYLTEMNNEKIPTLVKEKGFNYSSESLTHPDEIAKFMDVAFHLGKRTEEYIYMRALLTGAAYIVLVHNHPSGDSTPSKEDIDVCTRMKKADENVNTFFAAFKGGVQA